MQIYESLCKSRENFFPYSIFSEIFKIQIIVNNRETAHNDRDIFDMVSETKSDFYILYFQRNVQNTDYGEQ